MRLNIRLKLWGSFLGVILFLIIISAVSYTKMNGIDAKNKEVNEIWTPMLANLGALNGDISDIRRLTLKIILETDQTKIEQIKGQLNDTEDKVNKEIKLFQTTITSEKERTLFQDFVDNYNAYIEKLPPIMKLGAENKFTEAYNLSTKASPAWEAADANLQKLISQNKDETLAASAASVELAQSAKTFVLILSILASLAAMIIATIVARLISRPLNVLKTAAEQIAEGDITLAEIKIKNNDEIGELAHSFNQMTSNLRQLLQKVSTNAEQVAAASEQLTASAEQNARATEQIASTIEQVASGAENQVRGMGESTSSMKEISVGIQQISASTQQVSMSAVQTSEGASEGNKAIQTAVGQMNSINRTVKGLEEAISELGSRSQEIGHIVDVITGIAGQTNLLALNAAIEAARAGEHGRGFAVVADEVRKLAEQSGQSAQQIAALVSVIQEGTNKAVESMKQATKEVSEGIEKVGSAGHSFDQILLSINEVTSQIQEVSAAVQQMSAGTEQVVQSMAMVAAVAEESAAGTQSVSASTEEQLASMEEIATSASSLARMTEELQAVVARFKL